jgi:hypothetical protein
MTEIVRTKPPEKSDGGEVRWRNTGGTFRIRSAGGGTGRRRKKGLRIIKPNEVFKARPDEVPMAFRDTIIALDTLPAEPPAPPPPEVKFGLVEREGTKGWFDVINTVSGKAINDKALREPDALKLLESMS